MGAVTIELEALRRRLGARAAGLWRVDGDRLVQVAFSADPEMPVDVAEGFARATLAVPLDRLDLGIVGAYCDGRRRVSIAAELPAEVGSGYWLRAFGADRSVAVPIAGGVVSVALAGLETGAEEVERALLDEVAGFRRVGDPPAIPPEFVPGRRPDSEQSRGDGG